MLFSKPPMPKGYFVMIDFSKEAKEFSVGDDFVKQILHINNGGVFRIENYSDTKIKDLISRDTIIVDRTRGRFVPKESEFVPSTYEILGRLQISKAVY